jgi:hypothetical protein
MLVINTVSKCASPNVHVLSAELCLGYSNPSDLPYVAL